MLRYLRSIKDFQFGRRGTVVAAALAGVIVCALFLHRGVERYRVQRQSFRQPVFAEFTVTTLWQGGTPWHLLGPAVGIVAALGVIAFALRGARFLFRSTWLTLCVLMLGGWVRSQRGIDIASGDYYRLKGGQAYEFGVAIRSEAGGVRLIFSKTQTGDAEDIAEMAAGPNPSFDWIRGIRPPVYPGSNMLGKPRWRLGGFLYDKRSRQGRSFSNEVTHFVAPHWAVAAPLAVPPLFWTARRWRRRRRALRGRCRACGYDLRESRERCPECGTAFTEA